MIQRTVLKQCRTQCLAVKPMARSSLLSRAQSPFASSNALLPRLRQAGFARTFATSPDAGKAADGKGEASAEAEDAAPEALMKKEVEAKNKEIIDLKDKYLRSVADFRNLQERTKREIQAARDFAIQRFAKDLVDSVDNLDRALSMVPEEKLTPSEKEADTKDLINLYEGLKMTENILMNTLKKHGLERFDPSEKGEAFNPNEHEATFMTPMADKTNNTVFLTQQKGFKLNGRILRAAKVGVVKNE